MKTKIDKPAEIAELLRQQILQGSLAARDRLPSHAQLAKEFGTTRVTIHLALSRLAREGFVSTQRRRGTFVVQQPPHLHEYALIFPGDPAQESLWSRFYAALVNEAAVISQRGQCRVLPFYGINGNPDVPDYQRLVQRVRSHRVAGLFFANAPFELVGTPLLDQPGMPRVAWMAKQLLPPVPAVTFDYDGFFQKALDHLVACGRRRVALVTPAGLISPESFASLATARGLTTRSTWQIPVSAALRDGARSYVHLLLDRPADERPDGLLIADDNFVEYALAGVMAAGIRMPQELEVVAHCNFPWAGAMPWPARRLGCDIAELLRLSLAMIDRQRQGQAVPGMTFIPPVFQEELSGRTPRPPVPLIEVNESGENKAS